MKNKPNESQEWLRRELRRRLRAEDASESMRLRSMQSLVELGDISYVIPRLRRFIRSVSDEELYWQAVELYKIVDVFDAQTTYLQEGTGFVGVDE